MSLLHNVKLAYWNLAGTDDQKRKDPIDIAITRVKENLRQHQFPTERAEDVPESTAFRRAIAAQCGKNPETGIVRFARIWTRAKDEILSAKIFEQREDENGHLRADDHSEYELTEQSGARQINGPHDEFQQIRTDYEHALDHYTGSDVTKVIQAVLTEDGLGAYPCKKGGGVYFIPIRTDTPDMLDRLENFCDSIGVPLLTHDVPDLTKQRDQIADSVATSLNNDLDQHNSAITAYSGETKPGVVSNRRDSLASTETMINNLASLLNGKATELHARVSELKTMLDAKDKEIEDAAAAKRTLGPSRRIVTPQNQTPTVLPAAPSPEPTAHA